jgi:hypothetical protein
VKRARSLRVFYTDAFTTTVAMMVMQNEDCKLQNVKGRSPASTHILTFAFFILHFAPDGGRRSRDEEWQ